MISTDADRRRKRSSDPLIALHYQLSGARARGELDAIVVADSSGVVVAGAGSWPVCEELAAYAPLLAEGSWGSMTDPVSSRVDALRKDVAVRLLDVGGQEILLCARRPASRAGSSDASAELDSIAEGVARILSEAA